MAHLSNVNLSNDHWNDTSAGLIAVGIFEDKSLTEIAQDIDNSTNGVFTNAIKIGDIKGKNSESHLFYVNDKRVLLLGLGKKEKFNSDTARLAAGKASRMGIKKKVSNIAIECFCKNDEESQALGEGIILGSYQYLDHKTETKEQFKLGSAKVLGSDSASVLKGASICLLYTSPSPRD